MRIIISCFLFSITSSFLAPKALGQRTSPRERTSFNAGWRFQKNDPPGAEGVLAYDRIKESVKATGSEFLASTASGTHQIGLLSANVAYSQPSFDDHGWRQLDLPHDWGIEGPFKQEYSARLASFPGGAWAGIENILTFLRATGGKNSTWTLMERWLTQRSG